MPLHPAGRRDGEGRLLCRRCSKPVPKPRRAWCGERCIRESYWEYHAPFRDRVGRRDGGVCSLCGLDTKRIEKVIDQMNAKCRRPYGRKETRAEFETRIIYQTRLRGFVSRLNERGFKGCVVIQEHSREFAFVKKSLWEADHIRPRVLGGSDETSNGRTLCVPCHKAATKRLARYRKQKRRKRTSFAFITEDFS